MENERLKIGIYGLGLIGGSLLKVLHKLNKYILIGVSKSSFKKAEQFCDIAGYDINLLSDCDVVFVCSKMKDTKNILQQLNNIVKKETVVSDVCSIKGFLKGEYNFNYVPTHPMAGIEKNGFENSFPELFIGAKWIICKKSDIMEKIIKDTGAVPLYLNEKEHDNLTAEISHFPALMSLALFSIADNEAKKIASSGFRDTTRLAMTDKDLIFDMKNLNRENIIKTYNKFTEEFNRIMNMSEEEFKDFSFQNSKKRSTMYDNSGKNIL